MSCKAASVAQPASTSAMSSVGQWIWYRSIASTRKRRSEASHSRRSEAGSSDSVIPPRPSSISAHLVKTYGRSLAGMPSSARATTSSLWPRP